MIFQHPWISRSPRWIRGKVARMLAGKATIAVRVDHFGGETWGTIEVGAVEQAVTAIRKRHPSPTKNRQNNNR
jgi:nucleolar protein 56